MKNKLGQVVLSANASDKPHNGIITDWQKFYTHGDDGEVDGYVIVGVSVGHERFDGRCMRTSSVVAQQGDEIETLNSRYTLGDPLQAAKFDVIG